MTASPEARVVGVHADGRITLDRHVVTAEELTAQLASARRQHVGLGVVVRGDAGCTFQHVAEVLAACRKAAVPKLDIAVRLAAGSPTALHH